MTSGTPVLRASNPMGRRLRGSASSTDIVRRIVDQLSSGNGTTSKRLALCAPPDAFSTRLDLRRTSPGHSFSARSADSKPQDLCEPSQNGFFFDVPQRQRAIAGLSVAKEKELPSASLSVNSPSTTKGPLSRIRITTVDMATSTSVLQPRCWKQVKGRWGG